jgi:hypothetical protein
LLIHNYNSQREEYAHGIGVYFLPGSLLRFAHKTQKNRLKADFLPYKLRKQPDNRGFFAASSVKNPQVQQAASSPTPIV